MIRPFRLTLIQPCMGRRPGERYLRTWQMEALPIAMLAALTPPQVELRFYDDRLESIPYDEPADLVGISVETYTAKRAYQIASEYRQRRVPVVMGGFHASLCPDEVARWAEAVVIGEAEELWERVLDDFAMGTPQKFYRADQRADLTRSTPDRRIFHGKRYLPVGLMETGRGCVFHCEFCSIQTVFRNAQVRRPLPCIRAELQGIKDKRLFFFVDDNITSNLEETKELLRELIPLKIRWVSQGSLHMTRDEELLDIMHRSGCQGLLIGFESLNRKNLESMQKNVNLQEVDFEKSIALLHRHRIRIYGTFVFGYDEDTPHSFDETVTFARRHGFYLAAFAQLTPFPGTALYQRLASAGRLRFERWWLDDRYHFAEVAFNPLHMEPAELQRRCVAARQSFYSLSSLLERAFHPVNRSDFFMFSNFFPINFLHGAEVNVRNGFPLGDPTWKNELIEAS